LMDWFGIEPIAGASPEQALALAEVCKIEKLSRFLYRRLGFEPVGREVLARMLATENDRARRTLVVDELVNATRDQRGLGAPAGWTELYTALREDGDAHVRDQALELAIAFGDASAFADLQALIAESSAPVERRVRAIDALARGHDARA